LSRGFDPAGHPTKPLVSYQSNRQLSGWILPPLVKRAIGAHCETQDCVTFPPQSARDPVTRHECNWGQTAGPTWGKPGQPGARPVRGSRRRPARRRSRPPRALGARAHGSTLEGTDCSANGRPQRGCGQGCRSLSSVCVPSVRIPFPECRWIPTTP
jgi:hypothetical protein